MRYLHIAFVPLVMLSGCGEGGGVPSPAGLPVPSVPAAQGAPVAETLRPQLDGTCEGNVTVALYADGERAAEGRCENGAYALRPERELSHGRHCFAVRAEEATDASEMSAETCLFTGRPFVTVWKTDNVGVTRRDQIRITPRTDEYAYNYTVDWGDGTSDANLTGRVVHIFPSPGIYTVKINGIFPSFEVKDDRTDFGGYDTSELDFSDKRKLIAVTQWGSQPWRSMKKAFYFCVNTAFNATDTPDLSQVTDMSRMFYSIGYYQEKIIHFPENMGDWNISTVTTMKSMFEGSKMPTRIYDRLLLGWSVQPVQKNVVFSGGGATYSPAAAEARRRLTDEDNWTIYDGGPTP